MNKNMFLIAQELKDTYSLNALIDDLKLDNSNINKMPKLKRFLKIISVIIRNLFKFIVSLAFILVFMVVFVVGYSQMNLSTLETSVIFINLYFFWSIVKVLLTSKLFDISENNNYAVQFLKLDAKKYLLTNYYCNLIISTVMEFISLLIISFFIEINLITCLVLAIFSASISIVAEAIYIFTYKKNIINFRKIKIILGGIICFIGYLLPIINIYLPINSIMILSGFTFVIAIFFSIYIYKFKDFYRMFKRECNIVINSYSKTSIKKDCTKIYNSKLLKKQGCNLLNSVFWDRNKLKYIIEEILFIAIVGAIMATLIFCTDAVDEDALMMFLMFSMGLLVSINSLFGIFYLQKLFVEYDYPMLFYKKYRDQKIINKMFWERLKFWSMFNVIPTLITSLSMFYFYTMLDQTEMLLSAFIMINLYFLIFMMAINVSILYIYYIIMPFKCMQKGSKLELSMQHVIKLGIFFGIALFLVSVAASDGNFMQYMICKSIIFLVVCIVFIFKIKTKATKTFKITL